MASPADPAPSGQSTQKASLKPVAAKAPDIPFHEYEIQVEEQLLVLANGARKQAGAQPLALDTGLSQAARTHALAMLQARQLSHQFDGEPSLAVRLAATTALQLDQEGENVALDYDAEHGHEHLMLSPPHRANLLNPAYNVVGLGVVRSGDRLYIVQDFGHALPNYSTAQVKERIAAAVNQSRHQAGQSELARRDLLTADDAACSMAHADKLGTAPVHKLAERSTVLTYTSLHPETLPNGTSHALLSPTLHTFSIGTCYSRTDTYPTGVYWIVLSLE
ncbi:MAG: CAP domain-containing protein [Candidatus Sulfotelmatobacter sp.]